MPTIRFDFGSAIPTGFASWRGAYEEIALGYTLTGYDDRDSKAKDIRLNDFIKMVESAIGETFEGWKGGDFVMSKHTPVWVANPGNSDNTGIFEVVDGKYCVILMTGWCEY